MSHRVHLATGQPPRPACDARGRQLEVATTQIPLGGVMYEPCQPKPHPDDDDEQPTDES